MRCKGECAKALRETEGGVMGWKECVPRYGGGQSWGRARDMYDAEAWTGGGGWGYGEEGEGR